MNSSLLRLVLGCLLTFPTLLAIADDKPAAPPAAAAPADDPADLRRQLDEANDKLATALRSYSLLQAENDQLRAGGTKATTDSTDQIAALREQLRLTQAQCAALSAENAALRTQQALAGPAPGSTQAVPLRPGSPAAVAVAQPPPPPVPAAPPVREHTIAEGDTLSGISRKYYGTESRWEEILKANHSVIKNENSLPVGAKIVIP